MAKVITYRDGAGNLVVVSPAPDCGLSIEEIAAKDVPEGVAFQIVDASTLPPPPPPPAPKPSPREWLERLPADKQKAIFDAAIGNATLLGWLFKASGTTTGIDVTADETKQGVAALVSAGVLTVADQAILLTP